MNQTYAGVNLQYKQRNAKIYLEWLEGANIRDLAWRHCVAETTIRSIIRAMQQAEVEEADNATR